MVGGMRTLMQLEGCRIVVGRGGRPALQRRRIWGFWWQRVSRLPLALPRGVSLDEWSATRTAVNGWDVKMVWTEDGEHHYMANADISRNSAA